MTALIGMGGNLDDPKRKLAEALLLLDKQFGVIKKSSLYRTAPVGGPPNQANCYNAVVEVKTNGAPEKTMETLKNIELKMGRVRAEKWGSRVIDLDLLDQDGAIITRENLKIPHPLLHKRAFVLYPLDEIKPEWTHPSLGLTPKKIIDKLTADEKAVIMAVENWDI